MAGPVQMVSAGVTHRPVDVGRFGGCDTDHGASKHVVHDHAGIAVYLSGTTRMWMHAEYTLSRGDVVLVPEGMAHCSLGSSHGDGIGIRLCTGCMTGAWGNWLRGEFARVRRGDVAARRLDEPQLAELVDIIGEVQVESRESRPHRELALEGLMTRAVTLIARARPGLMEGAGSSQCPELVADALEFIEAHAAGGISLSDVARSVGRTPAHVATTMKTETGRTVGEWIAQSRMTVARNLLTATTESIEEVAERTGFASTSHFYRAFRTAHGMTPRQWRGRHA